MADQLPLKPDAVPPVRVEHPLQIISRMMEDGRYDVQALATLSELAKEWQDRDARKEYADALAAFQADCPPIRKDKTVTIRSRTGTSYSYPFAPIDRIVRVVDPILHRLGFSYSWDSSVDGPNMSVVCHLRHVNGHREAATFSCPTDSPNPQMSGPQKFAAALTFAKRYTLTSVLGLTTTDEDLDGVTGEVDAETVTESQAADLIALATEVGADMARFLAWLGVERFEAIPANRHAEAVRALERKRSRS